MPFNQIMRFIGLLALDITYFRDIVPPISGEREPHNLMLLAHI